MISIVNDALFHLDEDPDASTRDLMHSLAHHTLAPLNLTSGLRVCLRVLGAIIQCRRQTTKTSSASFRQAWADLFHGKRLIQTGRTKQRRCLHFSMHSCRASRGAKILICIHPRK